MNPYLVAAYGVVLLSLAGYAWRLQRSRADLRARLADPREGASGEASPGEGVHSG